MNTIGSWEAQTKELISRVEQEIKDTERGLAVLRAEQQTLIQALESYSKRLGSKASSGMHSLSPNDVTGKSLREILKFIALRNEGLLVVKTAIKLMKTANVFGNPLNADAAVYSILNRSKEDFIKVGRGVYKLNGHKDTTSIKTPVGGKSELKEAIRELKEKNPQLTKVEVLNTLVSRGFDFGHKIPMRAVHMAWVNMYTKKEKQEQHSLVVAQQSLPGVSPT